MFTHEMLIILLHFAMLSFAYFYLYPKLKCFDLHLLGKYDAMVSGTTLLIAALFFYNSHISFWLLGWQTNWFWFTIFTGLMIELPFVLWYMKRYLGQ